MVANIVKTYFGVDVEIHKQTFNLLACVGIAAGLLVAVSGAVTGVSALNICVNAGSAGFAFFLLRFARKTGHYNFCCRLTVIVVFMAAFPVMFFSTGGYHSGMPSFFVFAIVFTALMLQGRARVWAVGIEIAIYSCACLTAYIWPETVNEFSSESDCLTDVIVGFVSVSVLLLIVIVQNVNIHNKRKSQIEEQAAELAARNRELEQYRITKGPFILDLTKNRALFNGNDVNLTKKEFAVLLLLIQHEGRGLFAEEIYEQVWGAPMGNDTKAIRNHISNLRRKLNADETEAFEINYSNSSGYQFFMENTL